VTHTQIEFALNVVAPTKKNRLVQHGNAWTLNMRRI